jgi:hypothetical protein
MEEFREARANKRRKRKSHICIKEMHTHLRETELKEEEELKKREEAVKNGRNDWWYGGTIGKSVKINMLHHFITHNG